jgi:site-specific recombinase XerD
VGSDPPSIGGFGLGETQAPEIAQAAGRRMRCGARGRLDGIRTAAGLQIKGSLHKLRHTFCLHLAMRGAPPTAVQELAGHESLTITLRYMHLSPSARDQAIALLDERHLYGNLTATPEVRLSKPP